ncbi:MAG: MmgE/PrpD family protein [Acidobacteriaceae bacterium]
MPKFAPIRPEQDPAGLLAKMVVQTRYEDIPASVIEIAKKAIFDTLAVTIAGSKWEVSPQIVGQVTQWGGAAQSPILIYGTRVPAPLAAFANGVMARGIDMGDVHETGGHVTEWNVPAMLAALGIAGRKVSGREFLAAYVTSGELSVRVNAAMNGCAHASFGIPGEYNGPLGATAGVSRLLGLSADETWNALGIAYSVHGMSEMQKYAEGTQMARVQHSFAGETAIKAALLTRQGVTGPKGIFMGVPGGCFRHIGWDDMYPELLTEDLGSRWIYSEGLSLKPYSACKYTHSFISGTIEIMRGQGLDFREIASIACIGSEGSRMTVEPAQAKWNLRTTGEALYSAPYTIATAAIQGDVFLGDFTPEEINREDKRRLMDKITVSFDTRLPDQFEGFTVRVTMNDGREFTATTPYVRGHAKNPMSWHDLVEKFWKCVPYSAVGLPTAKLKRVIERCAALERCEDVSELVELLTP